MRLRYLYHILHALAAIALGVIAVSCGGQHTVLPATPTAPAAPMPPSGVQTIDGFPVAITEFPLPSGRGVGLPPVVGADGAIWLGGPLSLDRVLGTGAATVFQAPATPPDAPGATWNGFNSVISYSGRLWGVATVEAGPFNEPYSIALVQFTTAGKLVNLNLVAADDIFSGAAISNGRLWLFFSVPGGAQVSEWNYVNGSLQGLFAANIGFGDASGIAAGHDGNIYALTRQFGSHLPEIFKIAPEGTVLASFMLPAGAFGAMAFGPDGALWIAQADGHIGHMTTSGAYNAYPVPFAGSSPSGMTEGTDGAMWFTDFGTNAVGRITMSGKVTEYPVPTPHSGPQSIVSCPDACENAHGRLWFIETAVGKIAKLEY